MHPWLWIIAFAFSIGAAVVEDPPPVVQKAIAEARRDCKTVAIQKGFITSKDINGDGRPDFVLDYASFFCDGDQRPFCGSLGCTTQIFASLPNGAYAKFVDDNVKRIDFREVQGRPAIIVGYPGFSCGKDPTEVCDVVKAWNGSAFVDSPAGDGARITAERKRVDVPIVLPGSNHDLAGCTGGEVYNLDPKGDNFLSVLSGPGGPKQGYREIDKIIGNGQEVFMCGSRGMWIAIIYGKGRNALSAGCDVARSRQPYYTGPCSYGWVHRNYVRITAD